MTGSAKPPETARQRILAAATSVFSTSGYDAGSVNDVAIKAGHVTTESALLTSPARRTLPTAVLEARDTEFDVRLGWMADADEHRGGLRGTPDRGLGDIYGDRELMALYHRLATEAGEPVTPRTRG